MTTRRWLDPLLLWLGPVLLTLFALHGALAYPLLAENTGFGRLERNGNLAIAGLLVTGLMALWLAVPARRNPSSLRIATAVAALGFFIDMFFFASGIGAILLFQLACARDMSMKDRGVAAQ